MPPYSTEQAAVTAFRCAALGFDGPPLRELLRTLLRELSEAARDERRAAALTTPAAQVSWACAEIRAQGPQALDLVARIGRGLSLAAAEPAGVSGAGLGTGGCDPVDSLRLAWSSLALGGPEDAVPRFLAAVAELDGEELLRRLAPADVRPVQQLAWHVQQVHSEAPGRWTLAVLKKGPGVHMSTAVEQELSKLLQQMRVPHVVASPTVLPGGIYRVPIWFPQPGAVLDVDVQGDRLASGALGGGAELRRQQLQRAGLKVLTFTSSSLSGAPREERMRAIADIVAGSCPEAADWLAGLEAARAARAASEDGGQGTSGARFEEMP